MWRVVFVSAALLSILPGAAFGAGEYQRTKDRKTLIWNADPKPDDMASWWGARDKDGYAKGIGELTWYTAQGTVYARYYGNMVRGKFVGPVNVHVKRRIAHAFFIDGKRMTGWATGRASSRFATDWQSALAKEKGDVAAAESANTEQPTSNTEPAAGSEDLRQARQQTQESPAEGPAAEKKLATANPSAGGEEGAAKAEENAERSTPNVQRSTNQPAQMRNQRPEGREQKPVSAAALPEGDATRSASESHPSPSSAHASPEAAQDHGSVAELAVPPASLRREPVVETPSTQAEAELAASPSAAAQLTTDEAVAIADSEARARGYDLSQYQRPKADYSKVQGKWSLIYDLKNADTADESTPRLRVRVDDASRKADVNP